MEDTRPLKKKIRKEILSFRNKMDKNEKNKKDDIITKKFLESSSYKNSRNIFSYISYKSETDTKKIIETALKDGKNVYVPRTLYDKRIMEVVKIDSLDNLVEDRYGILEPEKDKKAVKDYDIFDLIIVPGTAFDKRGGRMGYGAGYYDKFFRKLRKKINKTALAYDFQIIGEVPMSRFDERVDLIITENEVIGKIWVKAADKRRWNFDLLWL